MRLVLGGSTMASCCSLSSSSLARGFPASLVSLWDEDTKGDVRMANVDESTHSLQWRHKGGWVRQTRMRGDEGTHCLKTRSKGVGCEYGKHGWGTKARCKYIVGDSTISVFGIQHDHMVSEFQQTCEQFVSIVTWHSLHHDRIGVGDAHVRWNLRGTHFLIVWLQKHI